MRIELIRGGADVAVIFSSQKNRIKQNQWECFHLEIMVVCDSLSSNKENNFSKQTMKVIYSPSFMEITLCQHKSQVAPK